MRLISALVLLVSQASYAAPPPPMAPQVAQYYRDFFAALPSAFPADNLSTLRPMISENLVVTFDSREGFSSREEWLNWLQHMAVEGGVERTSMTREEFFVQSGERVLVKETWFPYKRDVAYHPDFPNKMVSYKFQNGLLTEVNYMAEFRSMDASVMKK